jgi:hypothetical protein
LKLADVGKRYAYCLMQIADAGVLYWLEGPDGRCVLGPDDQDRLILPIWPHPRFAEAYIERDAVAKVEWADCTPEEIDLHEFMEEDLQKLIEDDYMIAAFPIPPGSAAVLPATEFADHLQYELDQIE